MREANKPASKLGGRKKNPVLRSFQLKTSKDPDSSATSSGNSPDLTIMSRPMSEESSVWEDTESSGGPDIRRRQNRMQVIGGHGQHWACRPCSA